MIFLLTFYLVTGILLKDGKTGMVNDSTQNSDDQQFHQHHLSPKTIEHKKNPKTWLCKSNDEAAVSQSSH
jgi:hypothetical protein